MPNARSGNAEADSAYEDHAWVDWEEGLRLSHEVGTPRVPAISEGEMEDTGGEELEASLNNIVKLHLRSWEQQLILPQG